MQEEAKKIDIFEPREDILDKIRTQKLHENSIKANLTNQDFENDYTQRLTTLKTMHTNMSTLISYFAKLADQAKSKLDPMAGLGVAMSYDLKQLQEKRLIKTVEGTHKLFDDVLFPDNSVQNDNNN